MLALVTELDGIKAILFHVEQRQIDPLQVRWRFGISSWREAIATELPFLISAESPLDPLEVEYRLQDTDPWSKAALHRFLSGQAEFLLTAADPTGFTLPAGEPLVMVAPSPCGQGCSTFIMAARPSPLHIPSGETLTVTATAASPCYWNCLPAPDSFLIQHGPIRVRNTTAARDFLQPSDSPPVLTALRQPAPFVCAVRRATHTPST